MKGKTLIVMAVLGFILTSLTTILVNPGSWVTPFSELALIGWFMTVSCVTTLLRRRFLSEKDIREFPNILMVGFLSFSVGMYVSQSKIMGATSTKPVEPWYSLMFISMFLILIGGAMRQTGRLETAIIEGVEEGLRETVKQNQKG